MRTGRAGRAVAAIRGRGRRGSDEGEERWVDAARPSLCRRARRADQATGRRGAVCLDKRPLTPGDILILVRSRGELASLIVARLFSAGVPVAGVDRLQLHEPLAVQDLLAAVHSRSSRTTTSPRQPAGLAADRLGPGAAARARLRARGQLWRELRDRRGENDAFGAAHDALAELLGSPISRRRRASSRRSSPDRWRAGASSTRGSASRRAIRSTN